jgi:L-threonylcarbamoyladenylate synthase
VTRTLAVEEGIAEAVAVVARGGVVAFPTDTVYGVGVSAENSEALRRLYALKARDRGKPIPLLLSDIERLRDVSENASALAWRLAEAFYPGALTLIVPLSRRFPKELNGGAGTVGVRVPAHPAALRLIDGCGGFLAVTSANRSGEPPATTADAARDAFGDGLDLILDGGRTPGAIPSTVVDTTTAPPRVLRFGAVSQARLDAVLNAPV